MSARFESEVSKLKKVGVEFSQGLLPTELEDIETIIKARLPQDLRDFLLYAVPTIDDKGRVFPDWRRDAEAELNKYQRWVEHIFVQEVEEGFWHPIFGPRPETESLAVDVAISVMRSAPRLVPVYGHRFMVAGYDNSPIISYQGALDSIVYGEDLRDYLNREFLNIKPADISIDTFLNIPFWSDILGWKDY